MIVLTTLDETVGVIGFQAEHRREVRDRVVAQTAPVVAPIESVGDQAPGGIFTATTLAGNQLILDREIAGGERLGKQLNGFVAGALLGRCLARP